MATTSGTSTSDSASHREFRNAVSRTLLTMITFRSGRPRGEIRLRRRDVGGSDGLVSSSPTGQNLSDHGADALDLADRHLRIERQGQYLTREGFGDGQ